MISSRSLTVARARGLLRPVVVARALAMAAIGTAAGAACVVNPSATQFSSQDSCPPYLLTDQASVPTNQIKIIDPTIPSVSFDVTVPVKSCNLSKTFVERVFLDGTNSIAFEHGVPPETGDLRHASFSVPIAGTLSLGCHRVELYVSTGGFALGGDPRAPATQGDLSYAVWFVYVHHSPTDPDSIVSECNR